MSECEFNTIIKNDETLNSNHNESVFEDYKIGLGGVAMVRTEALKIPLFTAKKDPNANLKL